MASPQTIGVLDLQGGVQEHLDIFSALESPANPLKMSMTLKI
jgi:glutamine amidotransferase PdxT